MCFVSFNAHQYGKETMHQYGKETMHQFTLDAGGNLRDMDNQLFVVQIDIGTHLFHT